MFALTLFVLAIQIGQIFAMPAVNEQDDVQQQLADGLLPHGVTKREIPSCKNSCPV